MYDKTIIFTEKPTPNSTEKKLFHYLTSNGIEFVTKPLSKMTRADLDYIMSRNYDGLPNIVKASFEYDENWSDEEIIAKMLQRKSTVFQTPISVSMDKKLVVGYSTETRSTLLPRAVRKAIHARNVLLTSYDLAVENWQTFDNRTSEV